MAEALPQIVWTAYAEGGVEWFNRRWYEYTGEPHGPDRTGAGIRSPTRTICAEFPYVRVIGLSLFEEGELARAIREAGVVDYLTKSGPSEAVVGAIRRKLLKSIVS